MWCNKCGTHSTRVKDTAPSHVERVVGRGKEYLCSWGDTQLEVLRVKPDTPFVVRVLSCSNCGIKYRTIEVPMMVHRGYRSKD